MTEISLKDRLRDHSKVFDSLLSLIPAKFYYGEDNSNQWQKRKQTKEQARVAKRSKLDPNSTLNRNAKEVLDERVQNKRKAREMENKDGGSNRYEQDDLEIPEVESKGGPGQSLKKRRLAQSESESTNVLDIGGELGANSSACQAKKLSKKQKKAERKAGRKSTKTDNTATETKGGEATSATFNTGPLILTPNIGPSKPADNEDGSGSRHMRPIDVSGSVDDKANLPSSFEYSAPASLLSATSEVDRATAEPASSTTQTISEAAPSEKSKKLKVPPDTTELRARLAAKIAALRAARKADGVDGTPIRTRQELIESRRKKQAERKAHKKELRRQAKEADDKKREQALASARNSPMLSFGSGSPEYDNSLNFAFGRVAFADGTQMSHDLSYVKDKSVRKNSSTDAKRTLAKMEAQKRRVAGMDEDKRKDVLEKETWLAARKRAEGETVRNDESLLKKAVKRKEKGKKKSEKEWGERIQGVQIAQKQRQQSRDENIRKRKEARQAGKAGKKKGGGAKPPGKKANRPGFEGSGFVGKKR